MHVTLILPTEFRVSWPFGSGEEDINKFSNGRRSSNLGFQIGTGLASFDLQVTIILPTSFESVGISVQETKGKICFQDGRHGDHLGSPIGMFKLIFSSTS